MPISSTYVSSLISQQKQQLAQDKAEAQGISLGASANGVVSGFSFEALTPLGRQQTALTSASASISAAAGVGAGVGSIMEYSNYGSTFSGAMSGAMAGRSLIGGAAGLVTGGILGGALGAAVSSSVGSVYNSAVAAAQQQIHFATTIGANIQGSGLNMPGMGLTAGGVYAPTSVLSRLSSQVGSVMDASVGSRFPISVGEATSNLQYGLQSGFFSGTNSLSSFRDKFSSMVQTTREVAQAMQISIQEAHQVMGEMGNLGFGYGTQAPMARAISGTSGITGLGVGQFITGAANFSRYGAGGMAMYGGIMNQAALANRMGIVGNYEFNRAGGAVGMASLASTARDRFFGSSFGTDVSYALLDESGDYDDDVASRLASGQMKYSDIQTIARRRRRGRQSSYFRKRVGMAQERFSADYGVGGLYGAASVFANGTAMGRSAGMADVSEYLLGIGDEQLDALRSMESALPQIKAKLMDAANAGMSDGVGRTSSVVARIRSAIDKLTTPVKRLASGVGRSIGDSIAEAIENAQIDLGLATRVAPGTGAGSTSFRDFISSAEFGSRYGMASGIGAISPTQFNSNAPAGLVGEALNAFGMGGFSSGAVPSGSVGLGLSGLASFGYLGGLTSGSTAIAAASARALNPGGMLFRSSLGLAKAFLPEVTGIGSVLGIQPGLRTLAAGATAVGGGALAGMASLAYRLSIPLTAVSMLSEGGLMDQIRYRSYDKVDPNSGIGEEASKAIMAMADGEALRSTDVSRVETGLNMGGSGMLGLVGSERWEGVDDSGLGGPVGTRKSIMYVDRNLPGQIASDVSRGSALLSKTGLLAANAGQYRSNTVSSVDTLDIKDRFAAFASKGRELASKAGMSAEEGRLMGLALSSMDPILKYQVSKAVSGGYMGGRAFKDLSRDEIAKSIIGGGIDGVTGDSEAARAVMSKVFESISDSMGQSVLTYAGSGGLIGSAGYRSALGAVSDKINSYIGGAVAGDEKSSKLLQDYLGLSGGMDKSDADTVYRTVAGLGEGKFAGGLTAALVAAQVSKINASFITEKEQLSRQYGALAMTYGGEGGLSTVVKAAVGTLSESQMSVVNRWVDATFLRGKDDAGDAARDIMKADEDLRRLAYSLSPEESKRLSNVLSGIASKTGASAVLAGSAIASGASRMSSALIGGLKPGQKPNRRRQWQQFSSLFSGSEAAEELFAKYSRMGKVSSISDKDLENLISEQASGLLVESGSSMSPEQARASAERDVRVAVSMIGKGQLDEKGDFENTSIRNIIESNAKARSLNAKKSSSEQVEEVIGAFVKAISGSDGNGGAVAAINKMTDAIDKSSFFNPR